MTIFLFACDGAKVSFLEKEVSISLGEEKALEVKTSGKDIELEWSSSDDSIVKVDGEGKITGLAVGKAIITVTVKGKKAKATIEITVTEFEGTISFAEAEITVSVGSERQLTPVIEPAAQLALTWESSDDDVVEVDQNGKINVKAVGEATITVKGAGKSATIKIIAVAINPTDIIIIGATNAHKMGTKVQLTANVIPNSASQEVVWSTSNEEIATVDANGLVEFVGIGQVTITARSAVNAEISKSVSILVIEPDPTSIIVSTEDGKTEIFLYSYVQMIAEVLPAEAQQGVTWSVSDESVATIGESTGLLYAARTGTVIVTATSNVAETVIGSLELTIIETSPTQVIVEGKHSVIQVEEELRLTTRVVPDLANQNVTFESSDTSVATVSENGIVVGIAPGTAVITVKAAALDTVSAEYNIKVVEKIPDPEHNRIIFNVEFAEMERYAELNDGGDIFYIDINAFASLDGVKVKEEAELFFYPGIYEGEFEIDKDKVSLKSLNSGKNPFTDAYVRSNEPVIAGAIYLAAGVKEITVDGLAFTGSGKIKSLGEITGFTFINNRGFDADEPTTGWSALRNYDLEAIVALSKQGALAKDLRFENNLFENVKRTAILISVIEDAEILNNKFYNFERDAIRVDGGYNSGYLVIDGNEFVCEEPDLAHNGIYFRSLGSSKDSESPHVVFVRNNYFKNLGIPATVYSGAISSSSYQEFGLTIEVISNTFETCANYIMLRNNATEANHSAYKWDGKINYNVFLGEPLAYYYINHTGDESIVTNPPLVNMDYNFYGDAEGNCLDLATIEEKFIRVASLEGTFTDPDDIDAYFVNKNLEGTNADEIVTVLGRELKFGEKVFATISDALEKAPAGAVIIVLPGEYEEDLIVDKAISLKTLNAGINPAVDDEPFKADSDTAATITGVWTVNASNIKIKGFSFTGASRVKSYGPTVSAGFSNFRFENNYVYDTAEATIAWNESGHVTTGSSSADAAAPGFVSLYPTYTWLNNYQFINNKFSNVSDTHVFMVCVHNVTFKGNVFSGGDRDAIRLEYSANYGDFTFEDNVFENIAYNGIYLRSYVGSPYASDLVANIYNNKFKNVGGAAATQSTERVRIGAIATRGYGETWSAYFNIKFNHFEDCANYISLRDNVTNYANWSTKGLTWLAVIEYNAFIDGDGVEFYFANLLAPNDTEATNTGNALINHNFYGSDAETKVDIEPEQFDYHREEESNTTVYETLAELLAAIEALDEEAE